MFNWNNAHIYVVLVALKGWNAYYEFKKKTLIKTLTKSSFFDPKGALKWSQYGLELTP